MTKREGSGSTGTLLFVLLVLLAFYFGIEIIGKHLLLLYPQLKYVGYAILVLVCIPVFFLFKDREVEGLLRDYWDSLNGKRKEK